MHFFHRLVFASQSVVFRYSSNRDILCCFSFYLHRFHGYTLMVVLCFINSVFREKKVVNDSVFQVVILKCLSMYVHSSISKFSKVSKFKRPQYFWSFKVQGLLDLITSKFADSPMQSKIHANVMAS